VRRIERESTGLSVGTATETIVWTDHGVLVCTPSTVLHSLKTQLTETSIQVPADRLEAERPGHG
jgi:hypothetical protein